MHAASGTNNPRPLSQSVLFGRLGLLVRLGPTPLRSEGGHGGRCGSQHPAPRCEGLPELRRLGEDAGHLLVRPLLLVVQGI